MFKRFGLRFSLLSLLLLVTLAAITTSHVLISLQNRQLSARVQEQRQKICAQNDELGRLTIVDPTLVCIINASEIWEQVPDYNERPQTWQFHVPPGSHWKLYWATANIPLQGLPEQRLGGDALASAIGEPTNLSATFRLNLATGWSIELRDHLQSRDVLLSNEEAIWLDDSNSPWDAAGRDPLGQSKTQTFSPDQPVVFLTIRKRLKSKSAVLLKDDPNPCPGFMIWIEPAPAE